MQVPVPACLRPSSAVAASAKQLRDSARSPWLAGSGICAFAVLPVAARGACLLVCPPVMCGNLRTLQCPSPHPGFPVAAETQGCRNPYVRPTRPSLTKLVHFSVHFFPLLASRWLINRKYSESLPGVLGQMLRNPLSHVIGILIPLRLLRDLWRPCCAPYFRRLMVGCRKFRGRSEQPGQVPLVMIPSFHRSVCDNVCPFRCISSHHQLRCGG